jgi:hypothetical protein
MEINDTLKLGFQKFFSELNRNNKYGGKVQVLDIIIENNETTFIN